MDCPPTFRKELLLRESSHQVAPRSNSSLSKFLASKYPLTSSKFIVLPAKMRDRNPNVSLWDELSRIVATVQFNGEALLVVGDMDGHIAQALGP